ncbi:MAG TPA: hypothetical protein V6D26_18670 [Stenomitos sp.]
MSIAFLDWVKYTLNTNDFPLKKLCVPHSTENRYNALLSLPENKNSSQRMKLLLHERCSDRKLIETHVLSPYAESRFV